MHMTTRNSTIAIHDRSLTGEWQNDTGYGSLRVTSKHKRMIETNESFGCRLTVGGSNILTMHSDKLPLSASHPRMLRRISGPLGSRDKVFAY